MIGKFCIGQRARTSALSRRSEPFSACSHCFTLGQASAVFGEVVRAQVRLKPVYVVGTATGTMPCKRNPDLIRYDAPLGWGQLLPNTIVGGNVLDRFAFTV